MLAICEVNKTCNHRDGRKIFERKYYHAILSCGVIVSNNSACFTVQSVPEFMATYKNKVEGGLNIRSDI